MFDAIIYFTDGTHIIVHNVSSYNWGDVKGAVSVVVDKTRLFFNISHVKCIGRVDKMGVKNATGIRK